jgi:hypothetical protein
VCVLVCQLNDWAVGGFVTLGSYRQTRAAHFIYPTKRIHTQTLWLHASIVSPPHIHIYIHVHKKRSTDWLHAWVDSGDATYPQSMSVGLYSGRTVRKTAALLHIAICRRAGVPND